MITKGLPTSGMRWGISCEVPSEPMLGVVLAYLTVIGVQNIAWAPIKEKDPARVEQGRAAAAAKKVKHAKKAKKAKRAARASGAYVTKKKPIEDVVSGFLSHAKIEFTTPQFRAALLRHGWRATNVMQEALRTLIKHKLIKRLSRGKYRKLTHVAAVAA